MGHEAVTRRCRRRRSAADAAMFGLATLGIATPLLLLACTPTPSPTSPVSPKPTPAPKEAAEARSGDHGDPTPREPAPPQPKPDERAPPDGRTRVVLLGTGTPVADPERSGPCVAVVVDDQPYLVDVGPGLVRRAAAAVQGAGVAALVPPRLNRAFITHLHSDHTVGLPDLIFTPWVLGRDGPLHLHGPPGLAKMAEHLHAAYSEDVAIRTGGLEHASAHGHEVQVHEIAAAAPSRVQVFKDARVEVTAFRVPHGSWEHAYGYRFKTPDRTIVISGDTGPSEAVVEACQGCDLLLHEVYSAEAFRRVPPGGQRYHGSFHTSTAELGRLAARARPGLLVLYHQLYWGRSDDDLVAEVRERYDGDVVSGRDLGVY